MRRRHEPGAPCTCRTHPACAVLDTSPGSSTVSPTVGAWWAACSSMALPGAGTTPAAEAWGATASHGLNVAAAMASSTNTVRRSGPRPGDAAQPAPILIVMARERLAARAPWLPRWRRTRACHCWAMTGMRRPAWQDARLAFRSPMKTAPAGWTSWPRNEQPHAQAGSGCVLACSALRCSYRDRLRAPGAGARFDASVSRALLAPAQWQRAPATTCRPAAGQPARLRWSRRSRVRESRSRPDIARNRRGLTLRRVARIPVHRLSPETQTMETFTHTILETGPDAAPPSRRAHHPGPGQAESRLSALMATGGFSCGAVWWIPQRLPRHYHAAVAVRAARVMEVFLQDGSSRACSRRGSISSPTTRCRRGHLRCQPARALEPASGAGSAGTLFVRCERAPRPPIDPSARHDPSASPASLDRIRQAPRAASTPRLPGQPAIREQAAWNQWLGTSLLLKVETMNPLRSFEGRARTLLRMRTPRSWPV